MPAIIVNDYTWRQSPEAIVITTRLAGHPKKIDLFAIDNYIKASYPPFILELFLWGTIVDESSECTICEETAVFTLKKREIGVEWPSLLMEELDREKKRAQRSRVLEIARVSAEEQAKARGEKRQELQRQAVREQIELDTKNLNRIEAMRDSHRREAMSELEDFRNRGEKPILGDLNGTLQENRKAYRAPLKWFKDDGQTSIREKKNTNLEIKSFKSDKREEPKEHKNYDDSETYKNNSSARENLSVTNSNCIVNDENEKTKDEPTRLLSARKYRDSNKFATSGSSSSDSSSSEDDSDESMKLCEKSAGKIDEKTRRNFCRRKKLESTNRGRELVRRVLSGDKSRISRVNGIFEENGVAIPRPRQSATIDVKFTERQFPTPARESSHLEEQEWLEKQAEARRKSGFVSEDLRAEEQDPQWLKDKGDEFFKAGNYLAAISAYTHGIKLSDKMSSLYVNRSAAHYAAKNYRRCAEDCSRGLELMVPKCEGNRDSRARCHARLGAALCKLSSPQHGIPELEAAIKLAPENETIKRDLQVARRYFEMKN